MELSTLSPSLVFRRYFLSHISSEAACSGICVVELTGSLVTVSDVAGLSFATAPSDAVARRVSMFVLLAVTSVGSRFLVCGTSLNLSLFVKIALFKTGDFLCINLLILHSILNSKAVA